MNILYKKLNIIILIYVIIASIIGLIFKFGLVVLIPIGIIFGLIYLGYWFIKNGKTVKKDERYCHRTAVCNSAYRRAHKLKGDYDD